MVPLRKVSLDYINNIITGKVLVQGHQASLVYFYIKIKLKILRKGEFKFSYTEVHYRGILCFLKLVCRYYTFGKVLTFLF